MTSAALLWLLRRASTGDARIRAACQAYMHRANGDADDDPRSNGERRLLDALLPQCGVAFDVGANVGDWTAMALAANPALRLHCFEPCKATFDRLAARGFPSSVQCNAVGLGADRRRAALYLSEGAPALNSLYRRQGLEDGWGIAPSDQQEMVDLVDLDGYCEAHDVGAIDYLKMDVEGHELDVLKGARRLFDAGRVHYGQFEYGGCNIDSRVLLRDLFEWLDRAGYDLFKLLPDRLRLVRRYDQRLENFQYQNWMFARRGLPVPSADRA